MSDNIVTKILRFRKSPDAGEECLCSLCAKPIYVTAVRCFGHEDSQGFEMRVVARTVRRGLELLEQMARIK